MPLIPLRRKWKRKHGGLLKLDISHDYYPNKLCYFFAGTPKSNYDLTSGKRPTSIDSVGDLSVKGAAYPDNRVLDVAYNASARAAYNIPSFTLPTDEPWEVTVRIKKGPTVADWAILMGDASTTGDFIGFNESGSYFELRNSSGTSYEFTGLSSFEEKLKTYTLTSDGKGTGLCTLKLYIDGSLAGTITSVTATLVIDALITGFPSNVLVFEGQISHIRVSQGALYNAIMVKKLQSNLYQILQSRTQYINLVVVAGTIYNKLITGSIATTGLLTKQLFLGILLTSSLTVSGVINKYTGKRLLGSLSLSGTLNRTLRRLLTSIITISGLVKKKTSKLFSASITSSSTLTAGLQFLQSITGNITMSSILSTVTGIIPAIVYHAKRLLYRMLGRR